MAFRKTDPKEQMRQQQKVLKKTGRELERDRGQLERQEKQLEAEIKKAAKRGDKHTATVLAKQLVKLRQQKTKSYGLSATITATGHQMKAMQSQVAMTKAMGQTSKAMASMNKQVKLEDIQRTMQQFEKESTKMDMAGEMMDDTMDAILSGDEDEEDEVIGQVLDEIGLEYTSKLAGAKVAGGKLGQEDKELTSTDDLEARLANLHAS
ncbi:PREDICTED: charged multivesicular body protein 2b-like [Amphimedon queenslandica]|uniref:Uncharacterized protein n=2 Tax=Amphimedon queenslandica TaxID=400682 RepID=A0A1X7UID5_AMPQE|nr:PREDICTED: charged multivesicular body protein 2b-like [Amphimedon queenslandica]|eukprot:XP_003387816.1 PREDICTED: charged multivesicular body protein 2b-like [Amphimedon queenslandica]